jgi:hypothetical protein
MDFFFEGFGFDQGKAVVGLKSEALEYTNTRSCSKKFFAAILLLVGFGFLAYHWAVASSNALEPAHLVILILARYRELPVFHNQF